MNVLSVVGAATSFVAAGLAGSRLAPVDRPEAPSRALVLVATAGAAVGALASSARPVGLVGADQVFAVAAAVAVALLALRASRNALVGAAALLFVAAFAGAPSTPVAWLVLAALPIGPAVVGRVLGDLPLLRCATALTLGVGVLFLPRSLPARVPTAVALVAGAVLLLGALPRLPKRTLGLAAVGGLVVVGAAAAAGALAVRRAQPHAEAAINLAEAALTSAEALETADTAQALRQSSAELASALSALRAPLAKPARLVPIVGQNLRGLEELVLDAQVLTARASDLAGKLEPAALRPVGGTIDLARYADLRTRVAGVQAPLRALQRAHDDVAASPWVLSPVRTKVSHFDDRLERLDRDVNTLAEALQFVPEFLGGSEPRRYLLVLPNTAEARGSGGVIGNFGEIVAKDGHFELIRFGRNAELEDNGVPRDQRVLTAPADYTKRYTPFGVASTWANMNMTPEFPAAAEAMANHYPQSGGADVDGVISADPTALAAFLDLVGPIEVAGWPEPLTVQNAAEILYYRSYVALADDKTERISLLADVATTVWTRLAGADLPEPARVAQVLGPIARGRHLQIWMREPDEQRYLERLSVAGDVPPVAGDTFGVVLNNASANKIEWFLHRSVRYEVEFDPKTGAASAVATIELRNDAPASGLPDYIIGNDVTDMVLPRGASRLYVSVYSALPIESWEAEGKQLRFDRQREIGRLVSSTFVILPPGGSLTMTVRLQGAVPNGKTGWYRLDLFRQPLVRPEATEVEIRSESGRLVPAVGLTDANGVLRHEASEEGRTMLLASGSGGARVAAGSDGAAAPATGR